MPYPKSAAAWESKMSNAEGAAPARARGKVGAKGAGRARGDLPEAKVQAQVARMLIRTLWMQQWQASHPEANPEERHAAWEAVRSDHVAQNMKSFRRALASVARAGVIITLAATAGTAGQDDDGED
jgi:hypothetical protein